jgi:hypothetical protein
MEAEALLSFLAGEADMAEKANGAAAPQKGKRSGLTKMEAVRRALRKLGKGAKPVQLQSFVREQFGIEMTAGHVSTYKGDILRKAAQAKAAAPKGTPPNAAAKAPLPAAPTATPNAKPGGGIALEDIQAVKVLVGRIGAADLKALIDVLAR